MEKKEIEFRRMKTDVWMKETEENEGYRRIGIEGK